MIVIAGAMSTWKLFIDHQLLMIDVHSIFNTDLKPEDLAFLMFAARSSHSGRIGLGAGEGFAPGVGHYSVSIQYKVRIQLGAYQFNSTSTRSRSVLA